jgi:hypothetical protein
MSSTPSTTVEGAARPDPTTNVSRKQRIIVPVLLAALALGALAGLTACGGSHSSSLCCYDSTGTPTPGTPAGEALSRDLQQVDAAYGHPFANGGTTSQATPEQQRQQQLAAEAQAEKQAAADAKVQADAEAQRNADELAKLHADLQTAMTKYLSQGQYGNGGQDDVSAIVTTAKQLAAKGDTKAGALATAVEPFLTSDVWYHNAPAPPEIAAAIAAYKAADSVA